MARTIILAIASTLLVASIIVMPDKAFQASLQGLSIWWEIVFPGLLPFLVLFEFIFAFGIAHALGAAFQPITQRIFKLPGQSGLVLAQGWMAGFPAGAEATAELRKGGGVTQAQGQRLLALAHLPNPLLILIVIGAGFLHNPLSGIIILLCIWLSALWLAWISSISVPTLRMNTISRVSETQKIDNMKPIHSFMHAMKNGRDQDGRSFGKVMGDAVSSSVQKLMIIGGLMIFCSVLTKLIIPLASAILPDQHVQLILAGIFEGHLGAYAAANGYSPLTSLPLQAAIIAAILSWSGLSGILQAGTAITNTDLKLLPFVKSRLLHALHAFGFTIILWKPLLWMTTKLPADWLSTAPTYTVNQSRSEHIQLDAFPVGINLNVWHFVPHIAAASILLVLLLTLLAIVLLFLQRRAARY